MRPSNRGRKSSRATAWSGRSPTAPSLRQVWQAEGPGGFAVAVKLVPSPGQAGALEAARRLTKLRIPHLLVVVAAWQVEDFLVLCMELADGNLGDRFQECRAQGLP